MSVGDEPAEQQDDDGDLEAIRSAVDEHDAQRRAAARESLDIICAALDRAQVTRVVVEYDGSGDSGQIEGVACFRGDEEIAAQLLPPQEVRIPISSWGGRTEQPLPLLEAIEVLVDTLLPSGYEVDDGAYGTATIDVATRKLHVEHNERYTVVETTEFEV